MRTITISTMICTQCASSLTMITTLKCITAFQIATECLCTLWCLSLRATGWPLLTIKIKTLAAGSRPTSEALTSPSGLASKVRLFLITNAIRSAKRALRAMVLSVSRIVEAILGKQVLITAQETRMRDVRAQTSISMATSRLVPTTSALVKKDIELQQLSALVSAQKALSMLAGWAAARSLTTESLATLSAPQPKKSLPLALAAMTSAPTEPRVLVPSVSALALPTRRAA